MKEFLIKNKEQSETYQLSHALRMLWGFFRLDAADLRNLIPISVSYGLLTLTVPLGVQVLINRILSTALPTQAIWIVFTVSLGLLASAWLRILQRSIVEKIQRRFHSRVTLSASLALSRRPVTGASHLYFDTFIVQKSLSTLLMEGLGVGIQLFFALLLLAFYHPVFLAFDLLIVAGLFVVVVFPVSYFFGTAIEESGAKHRTANFLAELQSKQNISESVCLEQADEVACGYLKARVNHFRAVVGQMIGLSGLHILANALLLGIGSYLVIKEQLSLGQLVAAELVFSAAFLSIEKLNKHLEVFYDLVAALYKVSTIVTIDVDNQNEAK